MKRSENIVGFIPPDNACADVDHTTGFQFLVHVPEVFFLFSCNIAETQWRSWTSLEEASRASHKWVQGAELSPPFFVVYGWFWTYFETLLDMPNLAKLIKPFFTDWMYSSNALSACNKIIQTSNSDRSSAQL